MITYNPAEMTSLQLQKLLQGTVMPRPIALASTVDKEGHPNLSPFSYFNVFGSNPGILVFSPIRRRDHSLKDTCLNVQDVPEVVINVVTSGMVEQANIAGFEFSHGTNEFLKSGLTPVNSQIVKPFRVMESPVHFECAVKQVIETGKHSGAGSLVICEILLVHISTDRLDGHGHPDVDKLDLVGRLAGDDYIRVSGKAIIKVGRHQLKECIGVDALPEEVRMSRILTGNDLGRLGACENLPSAPEVLEMMKSELLSKWLSQAGGNREIFLERAHAAARELISRKNTTEALTLLLAASRIIV